MSQNAIVLSCLKFRSTMTRR